MLSFCANVNKKQIYRFKNTLKYISYNNDHNGKRTAKQRLTIEYAEFLKENEIRSKDYLYLIEIYEDNKIIQLQ